VDIPCYRAMHTIHSREDIENKEYAHWNCQRGCHFQDFFATAEIHELTRRYGADCMHQALEHLRHQCRTKSQVTEASD
jgi:hypothetical protein